MAANLLRRSGLVARRVVTQRVRGGSGAAPESGHGGQMSPEMQAYMRTEHQLFNKVRAGLCSGRAAPVVLGKLQLHAAWLTYRCCVS